MKAIIVLLIALIVRISPSLAIQCGPRVTYPISPGPVADYDANCNDFSEVVGVSNLRYVWIDRRLDPWNNAADRANAVVMHSDTMEYGYGLHTYEIPVSQSITLPVNIRPSAMPVVTIEMFLRLSSLASSPGFLFTTTNETTAFRPRALMPFGASAGCSQHLHPYGIAEETACTLSTEDWSGFVHIAVTFDQPNSTATVWVNSQFSQSFQLTTTDALSWLIINSGAGDLSLVYARIWSRALSAADLRAVSEEWFVAYNQLSWTASFPETVLPDTSLTASATSRSNAIVYATFEHYNGQANTTSQVFAGYATHLELNQTVIYYRHTATFMLCRYPSMVYTREPFFANTSLCGQSVNGTLTTSTYVINATDYTRMISIVKTNPNETDYHVVGLRGFARMSYNVTFRRPVKQAASMPIMQPITREDGYEFTNNMPWTQSIYSHYYYDDVRETWTRLTEDRRSFLWQFDLAPNPTMRLSSVANSDRTANRNANLYPWPLPWTDDGNVPLQWGLFRNPNAENAYWRTPQVSVLEGIYADIQPDKRGIYRDPEGFYVVGFDLIWNYRVSNFDDKWDIDLCEGCAIIRAVKLPDVSDNRGYNYRIRTPVLVDGQQFRATLAVNTTRSAVRDAYFSRLTLSHSVGIYPPMAGTILLTGGNSGSDTISAPNGDGKGSGEPGSGSVNNPNSASHIHTTMSLVLLLCLGMMSTV